MGPYDTQELFQTAFTELAVELLETEGFTAVGLLSNSDECVRNTRPVRVPPEVLECLEEALTAPVEIPNVPDEAYPTELIDRPWGDAADPFAAWSGELPSAVHRVATVRRMVPIPREAFRGD